MQDSSDQTICKLQQENKKLKETLAQKGGELNLERRLWNGRESSWDSGVGADLHRIEVFDGVMSDESACTLRPCAAGKSPGIFWNEQRRVRSPPATCRCFATTNPGRLIPGTDASCASGTPCPCHSYAKRTTPRSTVDETTFSVYRHPDPRLKRSAETRCGATSSLGCNSGKHRLVQNSQYLMAKKWTRQQDLLGEYAN